VALTLDRPPGGADADAAADPASLALEKERKEQEEEAAGIVPPRYVRAAWRAAFTGGPRSVSSAQEAVAAALRRCGIACHAEHTTPLAGLSVDIWVPPEEVRRLRTEEAGHRRPARVSATAGSGRGDPAAAPPVEGRRGIAIEVHGPSHYVTAMRQSQRSGGSDGGYVGGGDDDDDGAAAARPDDLHDDDATSIRRLVAAAEAARRSGAASPTSLLNMRSAAKLRWLAEEGYAVLLLDTRDLATRPSTQEKADLLAELGLPVPRRFLSY
jgi:hypothetical protein